MTSQGSPAVHAVIPTCRVNRFKEFFNAWSAGSGGPPWDTTTVVVDDDEVTADTAEALLPANLRIREHVSVIARSGQDEGIGEVFSKRNSAIRCVGFANLLKRGIGRDDVVITLDDDCLPHGDPSQFVADHVAPLLGGMPKVASTVPNMHVRGLPVRDTGRLPVIANVGLWAGVPDLAATEALHRPVTDFEPPAGSAVMPSQQFFPMCGMNLAIKASHLGLFYFPPMGEGAAYDRYEDIWCGYAVQRLACLLGLSMTIGSPAVLHAQESDPFTRVEKEASGLRANELMWRIAESFEGSSSTPRGLLREFASHLSEFDKIMIPVRLRRYCSVWGANLLKWEAALPDAAFGA